MGLWGFPMRPPPLPPRASPCPHGKTVHASTNQAIPPLSPAHTGHCARPGPSPTRENGMGKRARGLTVIPSAYSGRREALTPQYSKPEPTHHKPRTLIPGALWAVGVVRRPIGRGPGRLVGAGGVSRSVPTDPRRPRVAACKGFRARPACTPPHAHRHVEARTNGPKRCSLSAQGSETVGHIRERVPGGSCRNETKTFHAYVVSMRMNLSSITLLNKL